jgi:hypothetical protein
MRLSAGAVVAGILLSLAAGASSAETPAAEWTRFRGPDGAGISPATTIPVKWTEKDFNWKVKLPA